MTAPSFDLHLGDCLDVLRSLPDDSVDAIVTDPPYGLSFMGKRWDYDVPSVEVWAECLRVLKPGGHLLAFAGTRTQHRMAVRIEDAGFEIRDLIAWVYGSGFPKSHDVSKAIDKLDAVEARRQRALQFTGWLRSTGITSAQIDAATGSFMGSHYLTASSQPQVATREHFEAIRPLLNCDVPDWVESMIDDRTVESENFKRREVIGKAKGKDVRGADLYAPGDGTYRPIEYDVTAAHTPEAAAWQGWGTALKPSLEPITVARKPLSGTVAQNVLQHGTGAINVDGCRVSTDDKLGGGMVSKGRPKVSDGWDRPWMHDPEVTERKKVEAAAKVAQAEALGRWPANLIHDGDPEVVDLFPGEAGDSAARFFYCAKASKSDRDEGLRHLEARRKAGADFRPNHAEKADAGETGNPYGRWDEARNFHPTVKPTDLMRYLCRLVTPPGGVVLDPFMGSGSTGKAAQREGFRFIGIERDPDYMSIARARIETALNPEPAEPDAEADNDNAPDDLFGWGGVA